MSILLQKINNFFSKRGRIFKIILKNFVRGGIYLLCRIRGFTVLPETVIGSFEMLLGIWEKGTVRVAQTVLRPGMTAVDIGAHVGYFTRIFSRAVGSSGKVYAFEPHPVNFGFLEKNVRLLKNVVLVQAAATSRDCNIILYESSVGSGSHSTLSGRYPASREIGVKGVTLDSYFKNMRIDFMKIDVEGAELEVLEGAKSILSRSDAPGLVIEFAPGVIRSHGLEPRALLSRIRGLGYKMSAINDEKQTETLLDSWKTEDEFISSVKKYVNLFCVKMAKS